jgi:putative oxidoreductase
VMRIVVGLMFLLHGTQKLLDFPKAAPEMPFAIMIIAGGIEFVGGAFVAAGFMTRWAAFLCSGLMAAAYWMAHGMNHLIPMMNGGEPAVVYCFVFLYIAAKGSGMWSVEGSSA